MGGPVSDTVRCLPEIEALLERWPLLSATTLEVLFSCLPDDPEIHTEAEKFESDDGTYGLNG